MHHAGHQIPQTARSKPSTGDKANPALERLHAGVRELLDSKAWKEALAFKAKFHKYSFNNSLLIFLQRPDASLVAGYKRWQELGRQVRKGETSIAILAPIVRKTRDETSGEDQQQVVGFRAARVFDVSQTNGDPIPDVPRPVLLEEDGDAIQEALKRAEGFADARGFTVTYKEWKGGALGSFTPMTRTITLRSDLPPLQTLKTLVHELAHGLMHADRKTEEHRHLLELEAESCAFLVLHELGLDTSRYSFVYLASWTENPEELLSAGEKASRAAKTVLEALRPTEEASTR